MGHIRASQQWSTFSNNNPLHCFEMLNMHWWGMVQHVLKSDSGIDSHMERPLALVLECCVCQWHARKQFSQFESTLPVFRVYSIWTRWVVCMFAYYCCSICIHSLQQWVVRKLLFHWWTNRLGPCMCGAHSSTCSWTLPWCLACA